MIEARVYRGIEFVRISELPEEQRSPISEWAIDGIIIKILMDQILLSDCIQYKDYCYWFESVYSTAKKVTEKPLLKKKGSTSIKLAMGR